MNFILKKNGLSHKAKKRRNTNCYEQTTGPTIPLHPLPTPTPTPPPPLAAKGFSLQPNQRSKTTRLTLFWLCLLTLETLKPDNLNVLYKTDSFDFHMNPNTEPHTRIFLHLVDGTNETGRLTAMQYIWLITLRRTIHVAMGTLRGKQARKKNEEARSPSRVFYWSNIKPACWGKLATREYKGSDSLKKGLP